MTRNGGCSEDHIYYWTKIGVCSRNPDPNILIRKRWITEEYESHRNPPCCRYPHNSKISTTVMEWNFEPLLYREQNRVKRFFNRIKEFRRFVARYDKLRDTFAMFTHLAIIAICNVRIRV